MTYRMHTSNEGIEFISKWEGFKSKPYFCQANKLTVGYGHVIRQSEMNDLNKEISVEKALQVLRLDLRIAEDAVNTNFSVALTQKQFDAAVSFTFNCGTVALTKSSFLGLANQGDMKGAGCSLLMWDKITVNGTKIVSQGLHNRRLSEKQIWDSGIVDDVTSNVIVLPELIIRA